MKQLSFDISYIKTDKAAMKTPVKLIFDFSQYFHISFNF